MAQLHSLKSGTTLQIINAKGKVIDCEVKTISDEGGGNWTMEIANKENGDLIFTMRIGA